MPKHTHKFYKQPVPAKSGYMWKCANCSWFVHAGLEHVIVGKPAYCWNCEDTFTIDAWALEQDKPMCPDCVEARQLARIDAPVEPQAEAQTETEDEKKQREARERIMRELFK